MAVANYDLLYRRWLKNPGDLLDRGGFRPGARVLDLCGGTGLVAHEALDRGAESVVVLDVAPNVRPRDNLLVVRASAERALVAIWAAAKRRPLEPFDLVVCRQAIAYLDVDFVAREVRALLRPDGVFVFNTFLKPRWYWKRYELDDQRYVEAAVHFGSHVFHLQWARGVDRDWNHFRHRSIEELSHVMAEHFETEITVEGRSAYFVCRR